MDTMTSGNDIGNTTVSVEVLNKIARLTTLSIEGVSRMANCREGVDQLIAADDCKGVKVQLRNQTVFVDVYVILESDMNVREISREIQSRITRTIDEMIGMKVGSVNVHIMDIDFKV
jgi:uncharacterized alkaline shock family protein YloU